MLHINDLTSTKVFTCFAISSSPSTLNKENVPSKLLFSEEINNIDAVFQFQIIQLLSFYLFARSILKLRMFSYLCNRFFRTRKYNIDAVFQFQIIQLLSFYLFARSISKLRMFSYLCNRFFRTRKFTSSRI